MGYITVFGGTFNPITKAHEKIVKKIIEIYDVDNFIFLPVGNRYTRKNITDVYHRMNMIKLVFTNNEKVKISEIELNQDEYKGTYHSLKLLNKEYDDIYFIFGADNLLDLHTWLNVDLLLSEYKFIVINRNKRDLHKIIEEKFEKYKEHFFILDLDLDISSSMIRENLEQNKDKLNEKVYSYIKQNNLYEVN